MNSDRHYQRPSVEDLRANIPAELRAVDRWLVWKEEPRAGAKPSKPPLNARTLSKDSAHDSSVWCSFDEAVSVFERTPWLAGVGFDFTEADHFFGFDLDGCRDPQTGQLEHWAQELVSMVGSYAEVSPSGTGVKIFARGSLKDRRCHFEFRGREIECYETGRYFAATGLRVPSAPSAIVDAQVVIEEIVPRIRQPRPADRTAADRTTDKAAAIVDAIPDEDLIERIRGSKQGGKFEQLMGGSTSGYAGYFSASGALCTILAAWTRLNAERIDRLYRTSGLFEESWWDDRCYSGRRSRAEVTIAESCALAARGWMFDPSAKYAAGNGGGAATSLVDLARGRAELFYSGETGFAVLNVGDHIETLAIRSRGFRSWLAQIFFEEFDKAAGSEIVSSALQTLEGFALFKSPERPVFVRFAGQGDRIFLDLADADWNVVEVTPSGWRVLKSKDCPVYFRRAHGMLPLPAPKPGGKIADLKKFVNTDDDGIVLITAWIVGSLQPGGPYPVLVLLGEHGTSKTTTANNLRMLIDPNIAPVRAEPSEPRDLMIAAEHCWLCVFDNLSSIAPWLSDALCRLSTGGGFSTRALFTDDEEQIFQAKRPVILTSIAEIATRGDLIDRAVMVRLPVIETVKPEKELSVEFENARPALLGALLDCVAAALKHRATVKLESQPRMMDFATWVTAAEPSLPWKAGKFSELYEGNREDANAVPLETPIAEALCELMVLSTKWEGTATELLKDLSNNNDDAKSKYWPQSGQALANRLRRLAPNLRRAQIDIAFGKRQGGTGARLLTISKRDGDARKNKVSQGSVTGEPVPHQGVDGGCDTSDASSFSSISDVRKEDERGRGQRERERREKGVTVVTSVTNAQAPQNQEAFSAASCDAAETQASPEGHQTCTPDEIGHGVSCSTCGLHYETHIGWELNHRRHYARRAAIN